MIENAAQLDGHLCRGWESARTASNEEKRNRHHSNEDESL